MHPVPINICSFTFQLTQCWAELIWNLSFGPYRFWVCSHGVLRCPGTMIYCQYRSCDSKALICIVITCILHACMIMYDTYIKWIQCSLYIHVFKNIHNDQLCIVQIWAMYKLHCTSNEVTLPLVELTVCSSTQLGFLEGRNRKLTFFQFCRRYWGYMYTQG